MYRVITYGEALEQITALPDEAWLDARGRPESCRPALWTLAIEAQHL